MNLFRMALDNLDYEDVATFCSQDIPEGVRLDYKKELSTLDPQKQVSKAVSAFANTHGGVLVFGVGTRPGTNRPAWPGDGMDADPAFEARVVRWCIEHIDPPITPQVGYVANPTDPTKAFGVLRVEPSLLTPHTVDGGTRVYVRRADNSDPCDATIHEIEFLRDRRRLEIQQHESHFADLKARIAAPQTRRERRVISLVLAPVFSDSNAVPFRDLPAVAEELRRRGFKIGDLRSYSHGLLAKHPDGFNFALTARAGLSFSQVFPPAGASAPEPIDLETLLGWSLLTAAAVQTLAEHTGYWGSYRVWFEATNHGGVRVIDTREGDEYLPCADQQIELIGEWSTVDVRDDHLILAIEIYARLMWSFGQHARMWSTEYIRTRLQLRAKERGIR